ncbi:hypothetical protein D9757_012300 [Collybiopsis confluens]|uniref:Uncharacterized protein n=1 Tax=Collybiopsis confluens TaxID=2823264 RepID=A0A8H5G5S0_9AGAR|nr:hypothetical protein D9757_012300 [Collybiopsis confluens]
MQSSNSTPATRSRRSITSRLAVIEHSRPPFVHFGCATKRHSFCPDTVFSCEEYSLNDHHNNPNTLHSLLLLFLRLSAFLFEVIAATGVRLWTHFRNLGHMPIEVFARTHNIPGRQPSTPLSPLSPKPSTKLASPTLPAYSNISIRVQRSRGLTIVPLLSQVSHGKCLAGELYGKLVYHIQFGGNEVVKAKDGAGVSDALDGLCQGQVCQLALVNGVERIHPLGKLSASEETLLEACLPEVKKNIEKGKAFVA